MAIFRFFNKYPQTDLHELNADYILAQLASYDSRIENVETAVSSLGERMDAAEDGLEALADRVTINEGDIVDLKAADVSLDGRLDAVEAWDVRNAEMLRDVTGVSTTAGDVTINFAKDEYANGAKTAGTDSAVIPAATTSKAGVITSSEKAKLNAFAVDGSGNAVFTGTVGGSAPVSNGDYATKQYVDSLAITGSAEVTVDNLTLTSNYGTPSVGLNGCQIYRYGAVRLLHCAYYMVTHTEIPINGTVASIALNASDLPPVNDMATCWTKDSDGLNECHVTVNRTSSGVFIKNKTGAAIPSDTPIFNTDFSLVWLVE